jgi:hypothetical protein
MIPARKPQSGFIQQCAGGRFGAGRYYTAAKAFARQRASASLLAANISHYSTADRLAIY